MFKLKSISKSGIDAALAKADKYRLLNDPAESESICLDVLALDRENQRALVTLILSITDQFHTDTAAKSKRAMELVPQLSDPYEQAYYTGIIHERRAKAVFKRNSKASASEAYEWFREAMTFFEKSESLKPAGTDDPILRWNACARTIMRHKLTAAPVERVDTMLE